MVIEEWRCGQKVGEIYRDIPIVTLACTPPAGLCSSFSVSSPPSLDISLDSSLMNQLVLVPVVNSAGDTNQYSLNASIGDSIKLNIATKTINKKFDVYLSNSFGFGGTNSAIVVKKIES